MYIFKDLFLKRIFFLFEFILIFVIIKQMLLMPAFCLVHLKLKSETIAISPKIHLFVIISLVLSIILSVIVI